jgi:hypothetical protein
VYSEEIMAIQGLGTKREAMTEPDDGKEQLEFLAGKLEFLAGRVHALIGFATAVIISHPDLSAIANAIDRVGEVNLARAEGSLVADEYVQGVLDVKDRLKRAVETAQEHRTNPKRR